jgi:DNA-binding Xre family transcriptional regulator
LKLKLDGILHLSLLQMAEKVDVPNNLGPFLTLKGVSNINIYAKTGIPTSELSLLRSGDIKKIAADKLFLIAKVGKIGIDEMLLGVYPDLKLKAIPAKPKRTDFADMHDFFSYVGDDNIQYVSVRTGITPYRLKNIRRNSVKSAAHELYLIELATKTKLGTLFNMLYKDLELNSPEEEARLRKLEKAKSSKK